MGSVVSDRSRRSRCDRRELSGLPRVGHPEDGRVLEEEVGVPAGPADSGSEGELPPGAKRERTPSQPSRLEVVCPDEVGRAAVAADWRHSIHPMDCVSGTSHKNGYVRGSGEESDLWGVFGQKAQVASDL